MAAQQDSSNLAWDQSDELWERDENVRLSSPNTRALILRCPLLRPPKQRRRRTCLSAMEETGQDMSPSSLLLSIHAGEQVRRCSYPDSQGFSLLSGHALVSVIFIIAAFFVTAGSLFCRLNLGTKTAYCCSNSRMLALFHILLFDTQLLQSVIVPLKYC